MAGINMPIIASAELGDFLKVEKRMQQMAGQVKKTSSSFKGLGSTIAKAAGAAALGAVGARAIKEAREAFQVNALTQTILKNAGAQAGTTAKAVGDLANNLSNLTGIDDELVQAGSNVLLSFGNIRNAGQGAAAVFDRATAAAVDLGAKMGTEPAAAAKMLGKALADPAKAAGALRKAGVQLTNEQQAQIKAMQQRGDLLGAQQAILGAVESRFKGAAQAMADPMTRLQTTLNNLLETVGSPILNALQPLLTALQPAFDALAPILEELGKQLAPVITSLVEGLAPVLPALMEVIKPLLPLVGLLGQVIGALTPILQVVAPLLRIVANVLSSTLSGAVVIATGLIWGLLKGIEYMVRALAKVPGIGKPFQEAIEPLSKMNYQLGEIINNAKVLPTVGENIKADANDSFAAAKALSAGAKATVQAGRDFAAGTKRTKVKGVKTATARPTARTNAPGMFTVMGTGGGLSLSVTIQGSVVQQKDIARVIRDEIIQLSRRQGASPAFGV